MRWHPGHLLFIFDVRHEMKMIIRSPRGLSCIVLAGCCIFTTACKKSAAPSTPSLTPPSSPDLQAASRRGQAETEAVLRDRQEKRDRLELVLPPPPGWIPQNIAQKLRLTLTLEKTTIHAGEALRYRVEIQNVSTQSISFFENAPGFIKNGHLSDHGFGLYVTPPGGETVAMGHVVLPGTFDPAHQFREYHFPDSMTAAEKDAAFERIKLEERIEADLRVVLQPGETLVMRPNPPLPNKYISLKPHFRIQKAGAKIFEIQLGFQKPETYLIRAVYDDRPLPPPSEEHVQEMIKSGVSREDQTRMYKDRIRNCLGFIESNKVSLTVLP